MKHAIPLTLTVAGFLLMFTVAGTSLLGQASTNGGRKDAHGCLVKTQKWCGNAAKCVGLKASCPAKERAGTKKEPGTTVQSDCTCPSGQVWDAHKAVCTTNGSMICPDNYVRFCGCDGRTYPNSCYAARAGVKRSGTACAASTGGSGGGGNGGGPGGIKPF